MTSRKIMTKFGAETLKKVLSNAKKLLKKDLPVLPPREFFHVYIIDNLSYGFSRSIWN